VRAELKAILRQVSTHSSERDALAITRDSGRSFDADDVPSDSSPDVGANLQGRTAPMPVMLPMPSHALPAEPRSRGRGPKSAERPAPKQDSLASTLPAEKTGSGLVTWQVVLMATFGVAVLALILFAASSFLWPPKADGSNNKDGPLPGTHQVRAPAANRPPAKPFTTPQAPSPVVAAAPAAAPPVAPVTDAGVPAAP
jgi:hypothetical protein